jgi:hypothetical protein
MICLCISPDLEGYKQPTNQKGTKNESDYFKCHGPTHGMRMFVITNHHEMFHDTMRFTICLFITCSPDLHVDGQGTPICFTICLFPKRYDMCIPEFLNH